MAFWEFLQTPGARLVIAGTFLAIFVLVAYWYIKGIRQEMTDDEPSTNDLLDRFRDLRDSGDLSPEEFLKIKTRLGSDLQNELAAELSVAEAAKKTKETPARLPARLHPARTTPSQAPSGNETPET